jgi:hypothetical protein
MLKDFREFFGRFSVTLFSSLCLEPSPQDEDPVPPYPHDGHQLPVEFFGMGQPVVNLQFDLNNPPPMGAINEEENIANNDDKG